MGCGVGTVGLCVAARFPNIKLTGIDIQGELIEIAQQNAELNKVDAEFICASIKNDKKVPENYFNEVMMNPPYMEAGTHTHSPNKIKATSHGEEISDTDFEQWVKFAHQRLKQGGFINIIHRADRLDDIIHHLVKKNWFGGICIYPMRSYEGEDAKRVIVRARKERYAKLKIKAGITIHQAGGKYSDAAEDILSEAKGIEW
jgi:tRNA1(Val) A37 N6-methylase TrmN6